MPAKKKTEAKSEEVKSESPKMTPVARKKVYTSKPNTTKGHVIVV